MQPEPLILRLWPKQGKAFLSKATELFYGGAGGGGKSHLLRVAAIGWCLDVPGLKIGIFRRTFADLWENHMLAPTAFPSMLAALVVSKQCKIAGNSIRFANGSRIDLHHCQHEKDRFSYQGAEFHVLMIDELTHFTEVIYRYLRSRVRMTGVTIPEKYTGLFPRILCSGNPGGIGHVWVKRTFVTPGPNAIIKQPKDEGGLRRQFIPSKLQDNPSLDYEEYSDKLSGLGDPILVRAMLDGDWSIVAGAMFGDVWRHDLHTCDPFAIPAEWKLWRGADDGYSAQAAALWFTEDPDTKTTYVIDELYRAGMLPEDFAERTIRRDKRIALLDSDGDETLNKQILGGILDAAAFGDTGQQNAIPRGHVMNKAGAKWKACAKWPGSRVAGCHHVHRMLGTNPKTGKPRLRVFRTCKNLIETLPALPRDPNDPEDVDTDAEDHLYDALRYGLQWKAGGFKRAEVSGI